MGGDSKENCVVRGQGVRQEKREGNQAGHGEEFTFYSIVGENTEALGFPVKMIAAAVQRISCRGH